MRVQAILRKFWVKAQKHDKMDGAEKLPSISQCQTTVVFSVTVLSAWSGSFAEQTWLKFGIGSRLLEVLYVKSKKKTQVPICLGTEMSHTGAEVSWCRFVPVPKCLEFLVTWPQNLTHWTFLFWTRKINKDRNHTNYDFLPTGICNQPFTYEGIVSPWTLKIDSFWVIQISCLTH